jgi:hypothetical protein
MYLAGILGLWTLLHVPAWGHVRSESCSFAFLSTGISRQNPSPDPAKPDAADSQPSPPAQSQPDPGQQAAPPESQPAPQASEPQPSKPAPNDGKVGSRKSAATRKKHTAKTADPSSGSHKKVVHRGSTSEPTTQLAPGITVEQATVQRQHTNQLLASTDESLQKLSARQLSKDEQETVTQIRKFMEQVKEADKSGDLQRAHKLAVKAHLLSDALAKP